MRSRKLPGFESAVWAFMNYTSMGSGSPKGCFLRIYLSVEVPNEWHGRICLPDEYQFADDKAPTKPLLSGEYSVVAVNEPLV